MLLKLLIELESSNPYLGQPLRHMKLMKENIKISVWRRFLQNTTFKMNSLKFNLSSSTSVMYVVFTPTSGELTGFAPVSGG